MLFKLIKLFTRVVLPTLLFFLVEKLTLQVEEDSKPECINTPTIEGDLFLSFSFFLSFSLSLSQSYPQIVNSSTFLFFISLVF